MLKHDIAPARFFSQTPNDIIRHPRLSSVAVRLLQWALSLPDDSRETIGSIAEKMPEGRTSVRNARRQLEAEGYVHTRRTQNPANGRWTTYVLVSNVPLKDAAAIDAAFALGKSPPEPSDRIPTVGDPTGRAVGGSTKVVKTGRKTSHRRRADKDRTETRADQGRAAALLSGLGDREPRLRLGLAETTGLAPLAARWLACGVGESELRNAMTSGLPESVHAPAALLSYRLRTKFPGPRKAVEAVGAGGLGAVGGAGAVGQGPPLPECPSCRDPFPRGTAGGRLCGRCAKG